MAEKKKQFVPQNLALWDRILRAAVASVIALLWYYNYLPPDLAMVALVLAGALFVNGLLGRCGIYAALGFTTCKIKPPRQKRGKAES